MSGPVPVFVVGVDLDQNTQKTFPLVEKQHTIFNPFPDTPF